MKRQQSATNQSNESMCSRYYTFTGSNNNKNDNSDSTLLPLLCHRAADFAVAHANTFHFLLLISSMNLYAVICVCVLVCMCTQCCYYLLRIFLLHWGMDMIAFTMPISTTKWSECASLEEKKILNEEGRVNNTHIWIILWSVILLFVALICGWTNCSLLVQEK